MAVASTATNSIHINDTDQKKHFRFDLLEFPEPAFGLKIVANQTRIQLEWSSSLSPLITGYEILASDTKAGPFKRIKTTDKLKETLSVNDVGDSLWFQVVSVSAYGLRAAPSSARENQFRKMSTLYQARDYLAVVKLADKILRLFS